MHGFLNINKPSGQTSRDVVDVVKRVCRPAKTGHTGTLDPLASGVLVICVGDTTRLTDYIHRMPKRYRATFLLDCRSESDDVEYGFEQLKPQTEITMSGMLSVLPEFVGEIEQVPSMYSAIKVDGERAYRLARQGKDIEVPSRKVSILALKLLNFKYPEFVLDIECGGGTYVRSLGRDIAIRLGSCAVMSALERTAVGSFQIESSVGPEMITPASFEPLLLPPIKAVEHLPTITVSDEDIRQLNLGRRIMRPGFSADSIDELAGVTKTGKLVSIVRYDAERNEVSPLKNFKFLS